MTSLKTSSIAALLFIFFLSSSYYALGQDAEITLAKPDSIKKVEYPVIFLGDTLGFISTPIGVFTAKDRAEKINQRLQDLLDEETLDTAIFRVQKEDTYVAIYHGDEVLGNISNSDAETLGLSPEEIANNYVAKLKISYAKNYGYDSLVKYLIRGAMLLGIFIVLVILVRIINRVFNLSIHWILKRWRSYFNGIKFRNYEFLTKERQEKLLRGIMKAIKVILIVSLLYLSLPIILSIFPTTKNLASTLLGYVIDPIVGIFYSFINYIPELFMILVISVITYYITKFITFISSEVERGAITIPGFYPDWAKPTFNLLKVIIIAFSFIIIFPYLPGSDSPAFQGVSVFLGLLISLGSSSAISNIIAGLVIIYMRAFRKGDRVKIGDTTGDVIEKTMLVTRIRTVKNEEVTIPNSAILNGNTVNYTNAGTSTGLILHSTVTIGYDVPWRQVHELLISAANSCEMILKDPKPFVLQTSLDDFYVSYQINAYTKNPEKSALIYSSLHSAIQDEFAKAKVEIMSPHYRAGRDGNPLTIPPTKLPKDT